MRSDREECSILIGNEGQITKGCSVISGTVLNILLSTTVENPDFHVAGGYEHAYNKQNPRAMFHAHRIAHVVLYIANRVQFVLFDDSVCTIEPCNSTRSWRNRFSNDGVCLSSSKTVRVDQGLFRSLGFSTCSLSNVKLVITQHLYLLFIPWHSKFRE